MARAATAPRASRSSAPRGARPDRASAGAYFHGRVGDSGASPLDEQNTLVVCGA